MFIEKPLNVGYSITFISKSCIVYDSKMLVLLYFVIFVTYIISCANYAILY